MANRSKTKIPGGIGHPGPTTVWTTDDLRYMTRAIRLAELGLYSTRPNPRVGCVLVKSNSIIAEGWHKKAGGPHAERMALDIAGTNAKGATVYVSLEPCCHYGRTPPCSDALIAAGVTRVVPAMLDPNPLVAGKGLSQLATAGIQVEYGLLENRARALNPGFIKRMTKGQPWVRCKLAMSLDGRIAPASEERRALAVSVNKAPAADVNKWISGESARRDVQFLRARAEAIVTGSGTVQTDNPALTVRLTAAELPGLEPGSQVLQPLRVVMDSRLHTQTTAKMLSSPGRTLLLCSEFDPIRATCLEKAGAWVKKLPKHQDKVDIAAAWRFLASQEINEVLLESGGKLAGAALEQGLIDEFIIYLAPHLLGDSAVGLLHLPRCDGGRHRVELHIDDVRSIGSDWRITARPLGGGIPHGSA